MDIRRLRYVIRRDVKFFKRSEVLAAFRESPIKELTCQMIDSKYTALSLSTWKHILEHTDTDVVNYKVDTFDCDNFMVCFTAEVSKNMWYPSWEYDSIKRRRIYTKNRLNGVPMIIDYSGRHAYSGLLVHDGDDNLSIALVEPQNDKFVITRDSGMYRAKYGIAIFL